MSHLHMSRLSSSLIYVFFQASVVRVNASEVMDMNTYSGSDAEIPSGTRKWNVSALFKIVEGQVD